MKEIAQIDMVLGMLSGEQKPDGKHHKVWIMGNSKGKIVQKMCLVEGKEGFQNLNDHAIIGQVNVSKVDDKDLMEIEQTPSGPNVSHSFIEPKKKLLNTNILWRYMELYKFKDIIENKYLHYSRLDQFSDNLEGVSSFECERVIDLDSSMSSIQKITNKRLYNRRMQNNRVNSFVSCWHINDKINYDMWNEYGNNNIESVCIRTSVNRFEKEISKTGFAILNEPVRYFEEPYFNQNAYWYPSLFKRNLFMHEKEFRSILFVRDLDLNFGKIKINPEKLIVKIYLHPNATKDFKNLIKKILKDNKMSIPVVIAKK